MNPAAPAINVRIDMAWKSIRDTFYVKYNKFYNEELLKGQSKDMCKSMAYILAIHYLTLIHQDITTAYTVSTTSAAVKLLYNYDNIRDCFACKGVYLDDLWLQFGIDDIVTTNIDTING